MCISNNIVQRRRRVAEATLSVSFALGQFPKSCEEEEGQEELYSNGFRGITRAEIEKQQTLFETKSNVCTTVYIYNIMVVDLITFYASLYTIIYGE